MDITVEKIYKDIVDYMSTMNKTAEEAILVYGSEILLLAQDIGLDNVIEQLKNKEGENNV
jgi:phosphoribosyl-ATP pyrophosphohydrolase